jgi:endonuclease YncB( thermonuclease family)
MVKAGLALDWPRYSKGKYAGAQKEAERAARGVWSGSYVVPWGSELVGGAVDDRPIVRMRHG